MRVKLSGNAANVRLLDSHNFQQFRAGRQHSYHGGHARRSPVDLQIPRDGRWYVVVDTGGFPGRVSAGVSILPGALPPLHAQPTAPISPISANIAAIDPDAPKDKEWDVFISHATEDKDEIVRPLALELQSHDLRVWYDEFELRIGDSLRRKIDVGLVNSRFGVVVLSNAFFSKNWPQYELDGLVTREMTGDQIILPLWHKISKAEVMAQSPSLADKIARSTSASTVEEIAVEIAEVVRRQSVE